jgi:hypothetical protein
VTAKGKPSGIATTITVIAKIKNSMTLLQKSPSNLVPVLPASSIIYLKIKITNMQIALIRPNLPISSAILSNFY